MRVSVSWLRALVPALGLSDAPGIAGRPSLDAREIGEKLTRAGLEVEGIRVFGAGIDPVVVAKVVEVRAHPSRATSRSVYRCVSVTPARPVPNEVCRSRYADSFARIASAR